MQKVKNIVKYNTNDMDIHKVYQKDFKFAGEDTLYYILVGEGGSASLSKNRKYYNITCPIIAIYDINAGSMVKKVRVITWPISCEEYETQEEDDGYFERFTDGVIYKVTGRLQYNSFGEIAYLYIKEVLEDHVSGTKLDKQQEKYLAPIHLEDEILGEMVLEKSDGFFEGSCDFSGKQIALYMEVEWSRKATWKKPLAVARDWVAHKTERSKAAGEYIAADKALYDAALEGLAENVDVCEIRFSTPQEFAEALAGRMKYVFVNQDGSYTIGYDDGSVFGGHEIDVDVDTKGKIICADMR